MKPTICCINPKCTQFQNQEDERAWIRKHGEFRRKCDSKIVTRFRCLLCKKTFSNQTFNPTYRQHRPRINNLVRKLIVSKVSMRQIAREFDINRKTVRRKFSFHAKMAHIEQAKRMKHYKNIDFVQIDEMETHEHSKCKPLSIALAVIPGTCIILGANSSEMPAKGPLAKISREKYGPRRDDRRAAFQKTLNDMRTSVSQDVWFFSDKKSTYPRWITDVFPSSQHFKAKGRRGCIAGYGEMKKIGFDPLFWINHGAATLRDGLARMLRKTWCNTKTRPALQEALDLFVDYHNEKMERKETKPVCRIDWLRKCRFYGSLL